MALTNIPNDIRVPGSYVTHDNVNALQANTQLRHKILLLSQRRVSGSVAQNVVTRMFSAAQASDNFGAQSLAHAMVLAIKKVAPLVELYCITLNNDDDGEFATGRLNLNGTVTANGVLNFYIGGVPLRIATKVGDDASAILNKLVDKITANRLLLVTAVHEEVDEADGITLTFAHKGETGNYLDLRLNAYAGETTPLGLTATITAMSGGEVNPDISSAIAAIGDVWYDTIITPFTDSDNLDRLHDELARRWQYELQAEAHVFSGISGTYGDMDSFGSDMNSEFISVAPGGKSMTPPWIFASDFGATIATENDPAKPLHYLPLPNCLAPAEGDRLTFEERNTLLYDGISTLQFDAAGNCFIEKAITTYQRDVNNEEDSSYLNVETMRTLAYKRWALRTRISNTYKRAKLADNGTQYNSDQEVATPDEVTMTILHLFREWERAALMEDFEQAKADLVVQRNSENRNRVDALLAPNLVNQFEIFAARISFIV